MVNKKKDSAWYLNIFGNKENHDDGIVITVGTKDALRHFINWSFFTYFLVGGNINPAKTLMSNSAEIISRHFNSRRTWEPIGR